MPTYTVHYSSLVLSVADKHQMAQGITQAHEAATGADGFFAQVIFQEIVKEDCYLGGSPLDQPQLFLQGQIRAGRSLDIKGNLLSSLKEALLNVTTLDPSQIWVYLVELPASDMLEYGHVLPAPGAERAWFLSLDPRLQDRLQKTPHKSPINPPVGASED